MGHRIAITRAVTVATISLLLGPRTVSGQQCPTRIPLSVISSIKTPEIRNVTASKVIDEAFIAQNGGAELMMSALRQDIANQEEAIRQNRLVIAQSTEGSNPNAVRPGDGSIPGSAAKLIEAQEDAIRADRGWLAVLQCWARQPARGGSTGGGGTGNSGGSGKPNGPYILPPIPGGIFSGGGGAATDRGRGSSGRSREETEAAVEARRAQLADRAADAWTPPAAFNSPEPNALNSGNATALVDPFASTVNTGGRAITLPFEYETPRANNPMTDFLKRVSGELRSSEAGTELSIHVGDVDRNWLTTDQCVTLEISFQVTVDVQTAGGVTKAFPVIRVPVNAADGTADVRMPVTFEQPGTPTAIRVTGVSSRACGAVTKPEVNCQDSLEARQQLLARARRLMARREQLEARLSPLEEGWANLDRDLRDNTTPWTATRVHLKYVIAAAQVVAVAAGAEIAAPVAVGMALYDLGAVLKRAYEGESRASSLFDLATIAAGELRAWAGAGAALGDAISSELEYRDLKDNVASEAAQLQSKVRAIRQRLATSRQELDGVFAALEELRQACGGARQ